MASTFKFTKKLFEKEKKRHLLDRMKTSLIVVLSKYAKLIPRSPLCGLTKLK